ncbi:hypothetical protein M407DRAFT_33812 [Tulasnella calospora MUT 4182]|uniref:Ribonuclease H1 N-terminal domain-containing protein n=1 Tax=Tulasnella calospora MUT 4182 TaxID=1051891 RepID=A0A0C3Q1P7_9AGAM|nr:hypothetical protein M407DRAFT_33812 [Tulasnella calospora MUT 4182]
MSTQKYYAVKIGKRPGVYPSLDLARQEGMADHPNPLWRSFRSMSAAVNYLGFILHQELLSNQGANELQAAHPTDPGSSLAAHSPPPSFVPLTSAPPVYSPADPESNNNVDVGLLFSFIAANGLVHADSIPPGREGDYQQDSILSSYYLPINQRHAISHSALDDDESQESTASTENNSVMSTENPFPDREDDHNGTSKISTKFDLLRY